MSGAETILSASCGKIFTVNCVKFNKVRQLSWLFMYLMHVPEAQSFREVCSRNNSVEIGILPKSGKEDKRINYMRCWEAPASSLEQILDV